MSFADLLDELDAAVAGTASPCWPDGLEERAGTGLLNTLFEVEMRRLVRQGPGVRDGALPRLALELALDATAAGRLPWAVVVSLRRLLDRLAAALRQTGAWAPETPLWWQPLPPPAEAETLWRRLDDRLAGAFDTATAEGRDHGAIALLPADLMAKLHGALEGAHESGLLGLEAGTVGAEDRRSARRSDAVRYVTGREPDLLAAAPGAALLVQWCLERLAPRAARVLAGGAPGGPAPPGPHPPQRAMLARYPGPSAGFAPHLDNPGGEHDNGRAVSLVLYLNPAGVAPRGGELALWAPGSRRPEAGADATPAATVEPHGGALAFFDSRRVPHQVRPLEPGPARWTLAMWLNDGGPPQPVRPSLPDPTAAELLVAVPAPALPEGCVLLHELPAAEGGGGEAASRTEVGRFHVHRRGGDDPPRTAVVVTTHGAGERLDAWCRHHLGLGVDHLVVVFDRLEEAAETATADRLRATFPADRLTVWSGEQLARNGWAAARQDLERVADAAVLLDLAAGRRRSSQSVAARQALNASVALAAARAGELGGAPVDWLLHLDDDELWALRGDGRGGARLGDHLRAAAERGHAQVRYANCELLLPVVDGRRRFKVNPHTARARLGPRGWRALADQLGLDPDGPRPWFHGYVNGKTAVRVEAGVAAAGVHGWWLASGDGCNGLTAGPAWHLDGPTVLHLRYPTEESFAARYLAKAQDGTAGDDALFAPSALERRAVALVEAARQRGAGADELGADLAALYRTTTHFSAAEVELLDAAGLLLDDPTADGDDGASPSPPPPASPSS